MKVFLAGEGPNELGCWADHPSYRDPQNRGVLETLLRKVRTDGWEVGDAIKWKDIRKYKAGNCRSAETRNVLGAVHQARRKGCDVVAFVRDRDDTNANPRDDRQKAIEEGLTAARDVIPSCPDLVGGIVIRRLESWLCALSGARGTEDNRRPEDLLRKKGIEDKCTDDMVGLVEEADLDAVPDDAVSLRTWLERAKSALNADNEYMQE